MKIKDIFICGFFLRETLCFPFHHLLFLFVNFSFTSGFFFDSQRVVKLPVRLWVLPD